MIGNAVTAAAVAMLALSFFLDLAGCSGDKKNAQQNPTAQASPSPVPVTTAVSQPSALENKVEDVIAKKKTIKRASTATYKNSVYGVSFRYPKTYTMLVPDRESKESAWPDPVAMNFTAPGGETLTTLVLPGTRISSYFKASVVKGVNEEQCGKFGSTPEQTEAANNPPVDPTEAAANPPVDADDDSIAPVDSNILGVKFAKIENVTDQSEARYYHHFENGACYEFALGVADAPGTVKPVDHLQVFDRLERIMTTVKIKSQPAPVVADSQPTEQSAPVSKTEQ
jgi:hypothetical protein